MLLEQPHRKSPCPKRVFYERHRPENTTLYSIVENYRDAFFEQVENGSGHYLPHFVRKEFDELLRCGQIDQGFVRLKCQGCDHERWVAFSCKRRGFCVSCATRRMHDTTFHLLESVFPAVPVRQWVLSFPFEIRFLLAVFPELLSPFLHIIQRTIQDFLCRKAQISPSEGKSGAVTAIQRFGSALNLNIHFHSIVTDGVYLLRKGKPQFKRVKPPTIKELSEILSTIVKKLFRWLVRHGYLIQDNETMHLAEQDAPTALTALQVASITYRIAFGPRQGRKVQSIKTLPPTDEEGGELCIRHQGFSIHAQTAFHAKNQQRLSNLCRYLFRPALAHDRLYWDEQSQVIYELKTPYRDGTTHLSFEPLEFMQKLAALVPKPWLNLIRYHGVFAPNAKWRTQIVPKKQESSDSSEPTQPTYRTPWAELLRRTFHLEMTRCPRCYGYLKVIAVITQAPVIDKMLNHVLRKRRAPP